VTAGGEPSHTTIHRWTPAAGREAWLDRQRPRASPSNVGVRRLLGTDGNYTDVRPRPAPARTKCSTRGATPAILRANGRFGVDRGRRRADDSPRIRANRVFRRAADKLRREMNAGLRGGGRAREAAVRRRRKREWAAAIRATSPLPPRNRGLGEAGTRCRRSPRPERKRPSTERCGAGRLPCARVKGRSVVAGPEGSAPRGASPLTAISANAGLCGCGVPEWRCWGGGVRGWW
jgi:hypothetical protein